MIPVYWLRSNSAPTEQKTARHAPTQPPQSKRQLGKENGQGRPLGSGRSQCGSPVQDIESWSRPLAGAGGLGSLSAVLERGRKEAWGGDLGKDPGGIRQRASECGSHPPLLLAQSWAQWEHRWSPCPQLGPQHFASWGQGWGRGSGCSFRPPPPWGLRGG